MVILLKQKIVAFSKLNPGAAKALNSWYKIIKEANWESMNDIRKSFNSADYVGNDRYVFNIKGNRYRLVAMFFFDVRTVYIRFIGNHVEYDRINCSTV